jgi:hypothetical protein
LFLYRNHIWLAGKRRENHRTLRAARRVGATVIFFLSIFRIFSAINTLRKKVEKRVVFDHPFLPSMIEFWGSKYGLLFCFS